MELRIQGDDVWVMNITVITKDYTTLSIQLNHLYSLEHCIKSVELSSLTRRLPPLMAVVVSSCTENTEKKVQKLFRRRSDMYYIHRWECRNAWKLHVCGGLSMRSKHEYLHNKLYRENLVIHHCIQIFAQGM